MKCLQTPLPSPRMLPYEVLERHRSERASATIIAIMVLFLLTVLGLALTLVTTTESMIAGNERLRAQSFYAADSGLDLAAIRLILADDTSPLLVQINGLLEDRSARTELLLESVVPTIDMPCNLCSISLRSGYESNDYGRQVFDLRSEGRRAGLNNSFNARELAADSAESTNIFAAQVQLSALLDIQPLQRSGQSDLEDEKGNMQTN